MVGLSADDDEFNRDIKLIIRGEINMMQQPLRVNILGAEEEELTSLDDVGHVIIGTEATVGDKHSFGGSGNRVAIDNGTESTVLILLRDGLDNSVRIAIGIQAFESSQVDTVDAFSGIALGSEIDIGGESRAAEERERRAIGGEAAVTRD